MSWFQSCDDKQKQVYLFYCFFCIVQGILNRPITLWKFLFMKFVLFDIFTLKQIKANRVVLFSSRLKLARRPLAESPNLASTRRAPDRKASTRQIWRVDAFALAEPKASTRQIFIKIGVHSPSA